MEVEKSSRAPIAFCQSCRAALLTILVFVYPAMAVVTVAAFLEYQREILAAVSWCLPAVGILALVRWLNRRDAPTSKGTRRRP
jgi:hypothetical protein